MALYEGSCARYYCGDCCAAAARGLFEPKGGGEADLMLWHGVAAFWTSSNEMLTFSYENRHRQEAKEE